MGWLFSAAPIPTWWTQYPDNTALLTGWLAGPKAENWKDAGDSAILFEALKAISNFFAMSPEMVSQLLAYSLVTNWINDPFSLGAYSYATPETPQARKQLSLPLENTLFFAGEALYDGPEMGTVEGALANAMQVAKLVLDNI
jgi:monoamine oxidase